MNFRKTGLALFSLGLLVLIGWAVDQGVSVELAVGGSVLSIILLMFGLGWAYLGWAHQQDAINFVDRATTRIIDGLGRAGNLPLLGSRLELIRDAVTAEMDLWERAETAAYGFMMVRQGTVFGGAIPADYLKFVKVNLVESENDPHSLARTWLAAEVFGRLAMIGLYLPDASGQPSKSHVAVVYAARRSASHQRAFLPLADARFHHIRP
jgi:hypothetical protein